jgi:mannose-6-phosphate isomerase-like protein (cupin superfamily)
MSHLNIFLKTKWFEVLKTTKRSQVAVMKLGPGQSTGEEPEDHKNSDQVLLVIEGQLSAVIDGKRSLMKVGDFVIIPPRTRHSR